MSDEEIQYVPLTGDYSELGNDTLTAYFIDKLIRDMSLPRSLIPQPSRRHAADCNAARLNSVMNFAPSWQKPQTRIYDWTCDDATSAVHVDVCDSFSKRCS